MNAINGFVFGFGVKILFDQIKLKWAVSNISIYRDLVQKRTIHLKNGDDSGQLLETFIVFNEFVNSLVFSIGISYNSHKLMHNQCKDKSEKYLTITSLGITSMLLLTSFYHLYGLHKLTSI